MSIELYFPKVVLDEALLRMCVIGCVSVAASAVVRAAAVGLRYLTSGEGVPGTVV